MSPPVEGVRRQLEWTRNELVQRLERIDRDLAHRARPLPADADDRAQVEENDEVLGDIGDATRRLLRQCDRALTRLDGGLYGLCEVCGFQIEAARLRAMPEATRCASCADTPGPQPKE
jgi:DnaK suppressor protein